MIRIRPARVVAICLLTSLLVPSAAVSAATVLERWAFETSGGNWKGANGSQLNIASEGVTGRSLAVAGPGRKGSLEIPVDVTGSEGLKLVFQMKSSSRTVGLNVFDQVARDNTTPYGPRFLQPNQWTPVLYRLDRFRYNSSASGFVRGNTHHNSIRFYLTGGERAESSFQIDNLVLYRGTDEQPPAQVKDVRAQVSGKGVVLSWTAAADNVAPMLYVISRAERGGPFRKIAECVRPSFLDTTAGQASYRYRVLAVDFEENLGAWSEPVEVTSVSQPTVPERSREELDRAGYASHIRAVHARGQGRVRRGHVMLFGDSLTGATLYPRFCQSAFLSMAVDSKGFAGQKTAFGRKQISQILSDHNPEFIFVIFGTNNTKDVNTNRAAMVDMQAIVSACERNGSVAVLGTIPPRGFRDRNSAPEARYNQQLSQLCRRMRIPTGYIFEAIQSAGPRRRLLSGDGVHWTGAGMDAAAQAWGRTFQQVRFALRDRPDGEVRPADSPVANQTDAAPGQAGTSSPASNPVARPEEQAADSIAAGVCTACGFVPPKTRLSQTVSNAQTLTRAVEQAKPGTTIWLKPGVYQLKQTLNVRTPGVVIRSIGGDPRNVFVVGRGMNDGQVGVAISISASDVTIADLSVGHVGNHAIQVRGENGVRNAMMHNLHLFDTGQQLLKGSIGKNGRNSHDCVVACSFFDYEDGAPGAYTNGVDVLGGRGWIVRDNVFRNIRGPLDKGAKAGSAILFWRECHDTVVERNVIGNCFRGIALGLTPRSNRTMEKGETYYDHVGGIVRNNIVWNLHDWADEGIEVNAARDVHIEHNTVFVTGSLPWSISVRFPTATALVRNNLSNRKIILRDGGMAREQSNVTNARPAWFVNVEQPDLRLSGEHRDPIDVGVPIDGLPQDFRLGPRQVGTKPDAGALEFVPKAGDESS